MSATLQRIRGPVCNDMDDGWFCDRVNGHAGRHLALAANGTVVHVWGRDVHRWRRIASRQRAAIVRHNPAGLTGAPR